MIIKSIPTHRTLLVGVTFFFLGAAAISAQDKQRFDYGAQWKSWTEDSRAAWVIGFVAGQDSTFVVVRPDLPPKVREPLRLKTSTLYDENAVRDAITTLYDDPANTYIRCNVMIYIARDKLAGKDIGRILKTAREKDTGVVNE